MVGCWMLLARSELPQDGRHCPWTRKLLTADRGWFLLLCQGLDELAFDHHFLEVEVKVGRLLF